LFWIFWSHQIAKGDLASQQAMAHFDVNDLLKCYGIRTEIYFAKAIGIAVKRNLLTPGQAKYYQDINKAGNAAKHVFGPAYFDQITGHKEMINCWKCSFVQKFNIMASQKSLNKLNYNRSEKSDKTIFIHF
jgi:hypothetical protein